MRRTVQNKSPLNKYTMFASATPILGYIQKYVAILYFIDGVISLVPVPNFNNFYLGKKITYKGLFLNLFSLSLIFKQRRRPI